MVIKKVQYSPHPDIVPYFQANNFAYELENASGRVISTMNRVRGFLEKLGVAAPSKNIVTALLQETGGEIIGKAVDIFGQLSTICLLNIEKVKKRVEKALAKGELQTTRQLFMPEILREVR